MTDLQRLSLQMAWLRPFQIWNEFLKWLNICSKLNEELRWLWNSVYNTLTIFL